VQPTDINDHLLTLLAAAIEVNPRLIVELGVRGGESTQVLRKAADVSGGHLISVDIDDCSKVCEGARWHFVQMDDVIFAREFQEWTKARDLPTQIDFLFVDTSHLFDHTLKELQGWLPLVRKGGKVGLHDSNQHDWFIRRNGTVGRGWKNDGVIRAIKQFLGIQFDESGNFVGVTTEWLIHHYPECNGFTLLTRRSI
jgi:cephalosporin hydroxylase